MKETLDQCLLKDQKLWTKSMFANDKGINILRIFLLNPHISLSARHIEEVFGYAMQTINKKLNNLHKNDLIEKGYFGSVPIYQLAENDVSNKMYTFLCALLNGKRNEN
jgi:hypothetical protein